MDPSDASSSTSAQGSHLPPTFLKNPKNKHISRSAAKRESVQLLGSIKDLQLHFSRAGLVEHRPGAGAGVRGLNEIGEEEEEENRPYGDSGRKKEKERERRPWKDVEVNKVDLAEVRKEARGLVVQVGGLWGLRMASSPSSARFEVDITSMPEEVDVRDILVKTAQAIRRVRVLGLSLSHHHNSTRRVSTTSLNPIRHNKPRASISTPSRPGGLRAVSYGATERKSSLGLPDSIGGEDDAGKLRRAALEVLAGLRGLEERLRITPEHGGATHSHHQRALSPSGEGGVTSSSMLDSSSTRPTSAAASAIYSDPEEYQFEEDEYSMNLNALAQAELEEGRVRETWEERLLSEDRRYRNMSDDQARGDAVRESVLKWIEVVNPMFGGVNANAEVAAWAKDDQWEGRALERSHTFLLQHLPLNLQLLLPPSSSDLFRSGFLARLSDGYILIHAFNGALTTSAKSWGFVSSEDIHDTLNIAAPTSGSTSPLPVEDTKRESEWTFRRVGNLTCWAAAVRLRYGLPVNMPSNPSSLLKVSTVPVVQPTRTSPSVMRPDAGALFGSGRNIKDGPRIDFDPMLVAKRGEGWEDMLETLITRWVECVAKETRLDAEEV